MPEGEVEEIDENISEFPMVYADVCRHCGTPLSASNTIFQGDTYEQSLHECTGCGWQFRRGDEEDDE